MISDTDCITKAEWCTCLVITCGTVGDSYVIYFRGAETVVAIIAAEQPESLGNV